MWFSGLAKKACVEGVAKRAEVSKANKVDVETVVKKGKISAEDVMTTVKMMGGLGKNEKDTFISNSYCKDSFRHVRPNLQHR